MQNNNYSKIVVDICEQFESSESYLDVDETVKLVKEQDGHKFVDKNVKEVDFVQAQMEKPHVQGVNFIVPFGRYGIVVTCVEQHLVITTTIIGVAQKISSSRIQLQVLGRNMEHAVNASTTFQNMGSSFLQP